MRKIKRPKIGDYVLLSRWCDHDPNDPWRVGFIDGITEDKNGICYRCEGSNRWLNHCFRITPEEGKEICDTYPKLEVCNENRFQ